MEMMSNLSSHGGYDNEVFGLDYYENQYYTAPQLTSDSGCNVPELAYNSEYYVQNIQVSYPVIPVIYGGTTYFYYTHVVYLPVYYYVPVYVTYQDPIGVEEHSIIQDDSNESTGAGCKYACDEKPDEYGIGIDYMSYSSVRVPKEIVSEEITLCYNFEEFPEKLCDAPVNSDTEETSSETIIEQDSLSDLNNEDVADTTEHAPTLPRSDSTVTEDEDVVCLYGILSSLNIIEVKEDMRRNYNNKKNNLYNEVLKGYTKKEKVLKELNWKWEPFLPKIPEETKRKKTFDMKKYYFDDCLRIPKKEPRYEEESEKYYLYQMLGSLKLDILEGYMEENYNKGKEKRYRRACKGYRTKKKHLKELQWESTTLGPIPEDEELQISKKEFKKNFRKDLKNIALQNESWGKYLADVLKKSVPTSVPISGKTQNEEGCTRDNQLIPENPQRSIPSSDRIDNPILVTPYSVLCKKRVYFEFQEIDEHPHPNVIFPDRIEDNIPAESTISLSKEEFIYKSQKNIEDYYPSLTSPDRIENNIPAASLISLSKELICESHKIVEDYYPSLSIIPAASTISLSKDEIICDYQKKVEDYYPSLSAPDRVNSIPPASLNKEELICESQKIDEDYYPSLSSPDRVENKIAASTVSSNEGLICKSEKVQEDSHSSLPSPDRVEDGISDTPEILLSEEEIDSGHQKLVYEKSSGDRIERIPDAPQISLNEEELDGRHQMIVDEKVFSNSSLDRKENEHLTDPSVIELEDGKMNCDSVLAILETDALAAANQNNHKKKRFSSLRKFLSRICCCKKTPPS